MSSLGRTVIARAITALTFATRERRRTESGVAAGKSHLAEKFRDFGGYGIAIAFSRAGLELASPDPGSTFGIIVWLSAYGVLMLVGGVLFGDIWFARADPFEVYSDLVSRLSPWGRDRSRRIVVRNPLDLGSMPVLAGSVALMATLLGSTAFDSFSTFPSWMNIQDRLSEFVPGSAVRTCGLFAFILIVGLSFRAAARATGGIERRARDEMPGALAHSLVPIVIGYVFAHYLTYLVEKGQATIILLADPLTR